jgi:uncharacterized protein (TIGR02453 family)
MYRSKMKIEKSSIDLLKVLAKNNNRDWFNKHKDRYLTAHANLVAFADALLFEMNKHDRIDTPSGKKSLHRIYRDVRFSKDKTPYNTHWSGGFRRATKRLRGSYYFHIEPGNTFLAGGFWGPDPDDMKRIRQDIDLNFPEWKKLFASKVIAVTFGKLKGEQVRSAPKGFKKDHPAIEFLRFKQFLLIRRFTDTEMMSPGFVKKATDTFKKMRPFLDHMSEVLTTDLNGESILAE